MNTCDNRCIMLWLSTVCVCVTHSPTAMTVVSTEGEAEICVAVHTHHHLRDRDQGGSFLSQRELQTISDLKKETHI